MAARADRARSAAGPDPRIRAGGPVFATRGHDAALAAVHRAIVTGRAPHALLLSGPRGVGKTTLALDLAAGLLCDAEEPSARPCGSCSSCRRVASGDHPDVHRLTPEGAGDQIRIGPVLELTMALSLHAMEGGHRIAIVSAAQRMNPDAQNALLKTLEEPGPRTCIVMCADETAPLLPTVLSRAARLRLAPMPLPELTDLLIERDGRLPPAQARSAAVAAGGRPGIALRLADQPDAILARGRISRTLLDLVGADRRRRLDSATELVADASLLDGALAGTVASAPAALQPSERRRAVLTLIGTWRDVARELAVVGAGGRREVRDHDLLDELRAVAEVVDLASVRPFLDRLERSAAAVEAYASPPLVLDVLLLAWPRAGMPSTQAARTAPAA